MYAAKERGKGRHAVYDAELEQHQAADAQLGAELRQALDNGEFSLVYQPIVRLPDGQWTGLETLVRWHSPARGFVGPDVFIPIAERTGLIVPLGDWILRTALRQAAAWDAAFGPAAPREIGINVSARQLREPGFADDVRDGARRDRRSTRSGWSSRSPRPRCSTAGSAVDTLQDLVGAGRAGGAGRLRHRALVAGPAAHLPGRHPQGGQVVRRRHRRPLRGGGDRHRDDPDHQRPAPAGGRRGRGDRRAGRDAVPARLPVRAGLPLLPAAVPRPGAGAAGRGESTQRDRSAMRRVADLSRCGSRPASKAAQSGATVSKLAAPPSSAAW